MEFEGNTAFNDRVLRKQMKTKGKTMLAIFDKSGRLDEAQLQQDLDAVREHYQNNGYVDVEIRDVRRERGEGRMNLVVVVNEGPKYTVGRVTFKGYKTTTEEKLRKVDQAEGRRTSTRRKPSATTPRRSPTPTARAVSSIS